MFVKLIYSQLAVFTDVFCVCQEPHAETASWISKTSLAHAGCGFTVVAPCRSHMSVHMNL